MGGWKCRTNSHISSIHAQPTQNGTIKLYKELKCPLDDFELLLFSLGTSTHLSIHS